MLVSSVFCVSREADHSLRKMLPVLCVRLIVCDLETSTMGWPRFELGCRVTEKEQCLLMTTKLPTHHYMILSNLPLIFPSLIHVSLSVVHSNKPSPVYAQNISLFGSYCYFSKNVRFM